MKNNIRFYDDLSWYSLLDSIGNVVHLLCLKGAVSFTLDRIHYTVNASEFVIFINGASVGDIRQSPDFKAIVMIFSEAFYLKDCVTGNYGIVGYLSLLNNAVMPLSHDDFTICRDSMEMLRRRLIDTQHAFHQQLIGALLKAHVLDLHDIHSKLYKQVPPSSRPAIVMGKYIAMLEKGDYVEHRDLAYYSNRLCISSHYLSEVSRLLSGRPATYWIERFTILELIKRLRAGGLTLAELSYTFHFCSVSYLSRFIKHQTGYTASELLRSFK